MKKTNSKKAKRIIKEHIERFYPGEMLMFQVSNFKRNNETDYEVIYRMASNNKFGDLYNIKTLIKMLRNNSIEIGKDNLSSEGKMYSWYCKIIALNGEKKINNFLNKEDENPNKKTAKLIKKLGYGAIAREIEKDRRPIQNINFLINDITGKNSNDKMFKKLGMPKEQLLKKLGEMKDKIKPNSPKILKYITLERKRDNLLWEIAQLSYRIKNESDKDGQLYAKLRPIYIKKEKELEKIKEDMFDIVKG
jgi:hypothetical protein